MGTVEGASLLKSVGAAKYEARDYEGAREAFAQARRIREQTGSLMTQEGAQLLASLGLNRRAYGDFRGALAAFEEARGIHRA
eukprot:CAMPEP_0198584054 /NCGR_PEP_ID=MMETSP1462-20131121/127560_1 /TAXON_ID=1333877 /ORGANISM="Brandtodinium nutriculum, Strain RCC3387" /LENGTH=81 /DNA_ID=CAMNT_0044315465 /DNA_START=18 /DNA_END=259 /DNA_ORIENTATION=+